MPKSNPDANSFLFELDSIRATSARKVHLRRLYDVLQLSLQRHDVTRARRAWSILSRCPEIDWKRMWLTGVRVLGVQLHDTDSSASRIVYLRAMMLQTSTEVSNPTSGKFVDEQLLTA